MVLLWSKSYSVWFQSLLIYYDLVCDLTYGLSWRMFHEHLRRMRIPLFSVVYICISLGFNWFKELFDSPIFLLIFCWVAPSFIENVILVSPTITVSSFHFHLLLCFIYFGAIPLCVHMFILLHLLDRVNTLIIYNTFRHIHFCLKKLIFS